MDIELAENGRMYESGSSLMRLIQNNEMPILDLFIRESIQNSLDAAKNGKKYTLVKYQTGQFKARTLNNELSGISEKMNQKYSREYYDFLAVRDSLTVGLIGEEDSDKTSEYARKENFQKLVFDISNAQTKEGAGGSWGLGKTIYFRVGIGLVIYYSRIQKVNGLYESRLIATFVEDERKPDCIIPKNNRCSRGIAWWGKLTRGNHVVSVHDEEYIHEFLKNFNIEPYTSAETGTTIIIPYIDKEKLLNNNKVDYEYNDTSIKIPWQSSIEEYLKIGIQRWYVPRMNNPNFPHRNFLRCFVNNNFVKTDEPLFSIMKDLYNVSQGLSNLCEYCEENLIHINVKDINSTKLSPQLSGRVAFCKVTKEQLEMTYPNNKKNPYIYAGIPDHSGDTNPPILAITRGPGMIVSYFDDGPWVHKIPDTLENEYLICVFSVNSKARVKNTQFTLEEYLRKSEKADHNSWTDFTIGDDYSPNIVKLIQKNVSNKIAEEYKGAKINIEQKVNTTLGIKLAKLLLPPDGFGNMPSLKKNKNTNLSKKRSAARKSSMKVSDTGVTFLDDSITFNADFIVKENIQKLSTHIGVQAEGGNILATKWLKEYKIDFPFYFQRLEFENLKINGHRISSPVPLTVMHRSQVVNGVRFALKKVKNSGENLLAFVIESPNEEKRVELNAKITIHVSRRDFRPTLVKRKEVSRNG